MLGTCDKNESVMSGKKDFDAVLARIGAKHAAGKAAPAKAPPRQASRKAPRLPWTAIPNFYFDFELPQLPLPDRSTLTYILRRTYGWNKREDPISLHQFVHGKRVNGRLLDYGAGLSLAQVKRSLKSLEERGYIRRRRVDDPRGGHLCTVIELIFEDEE